MFQINIYPVIVLKTADIFLFILKVGRGDFWCHCKWKANIVGMKICVWKIGKRNKISFSAYVCFRLEQKKKHFFLFYIAAPLRILILQDRYFYIEMGEGSSTYLSLTNNSVWSNMCMIFVYISEIFDPMSKNKGVIKCLLRQSVNHIENKT